jgi:hypothetical protein
MWPRTDSVKLPGVALSGGFATLAQVSAQLRSAIRHGAGAADGWLGPVVELAPIPVHHRALGQTFKTARPLVAGSTVESRRQC